MKITTLIKKLVKLKTSIGSDVEVYLDEDRKESIKNCSHYITQLKNKETVSHVWIYSKKSYNVKGWKHKPKE